MKKITTLVQESEKDLLIETAAKSFEKELTALVEKYTSSIEESLKPQFAAKLSNILKK